MSEGYVVGTPRPSSHRCQWSELEAPDVADLGEALVHTLAVELRRRGVAGSESVSRWELAEQIRETLLRHHRTARVRAEEQGR